VFSVLKKILHILITAKPVFRVIELLRKEIPMEYRLLGNTGIRVSAISFGAGPVPALMTDGSQAAIQRQTVHRAIEVGINWFDTAATYGDGESEKNLGATLKELGAPACPDSRDAGRSSSVYIATKVRLMPDQLDNIEENVKNSVMGSLKRLQLERVTLIQLHNSITQNRGDQYTSITPQDVLGPGGVLDAFEALKSDGSVQHIGLTGLGDISALLEVIRSGAFETIQVCYNILNPSAGQPMPKGFDDIDYGNIIAECTRQNMGVIAIRVFAGGALAGNPPSAYTLKAQVFPLSLYERDMERAAQLSKALLPGVSLKEAGLRFVLSEPSISTALIGFSNPAQIDEAIRYCSAGPLSKQIVEKLSNL
jgi:L-galactose dehydrogenase/L-glyceraldehyde 3-phosphate reductase